MKDLDRIRQVLAAVLHVPAGELGEDRPLAEVTALDSLSLAEVASAVDDAFDIRIPGDRLTTRLTLRELAQLVAESPSR